MPRPTTPNKVGGTTLASAYQKIRTIQTREWAAGERINRFYRDLSQGYKQTLESAFFRYFVYPLDSQPHWDAVSALRSDVTGTLDEAFQSATDDVLEATDETADEELEESYLQGWYFGLWDVYQAGTDVNGTEPPESAAIGLSMAAAAIGGLSVLDRARRWIDESRAKHSTGIRGIIQNEATLPDTIMWFDGISSVLNNRVSGLVVNEMHRMFERGQADAVALFGGLVIGDVWVTRDDARVCPRCAELHMTITTLRPIEDTHPSCRCFKIPLLEGAGTRPVDFEFFMSELR